MKSSRFLLLPLAFLIFTSNLEAQKRRVILKSRNTSAVQKAAETENTAIVIDELLSVLRQKPSLFAASIQRMQRGRKVQILETKQADGVTFYRVSVPPNNYGWVQSEAVYGRFRRGDDERLAKLIQASSGFDQIEIAVKFLELYPNSLLRPAILLLFGDLVEETAVKLSRDATRRLNQREMAASGAPLHSFYLNFVSLDRYRKLGITFLFNPQTKNFHYDGASWREIVEKFPKSGEFAEAQKRLAALKEKMEKGQAK